MLTARTIDDGEFSIHRKRVSRSSFRGQSHSDPSVHSLDPLKPHRRSQRRQRPLVSNHALLCAPQLHGPSLFFSGSPLKHITDMPPPASKKSSKLRGSSITRESSNAPSVDNESRMSVFSPEATPVSPTSSADSPSTAPVQATNGTHTRKSGVTNTLPATSAAPPQPNAHDASYMMMGKRNFQRTLVRNN